MSFASSQCASAGRLSIWGASRVPVVLAACGGASFCAPVAVASADSFAYTGVEQTYTVPAGVSSVRIAATGGAGAGPAAGSGLSGGRGGVATGVVAVTPGQVLYVYVGGAGGQPMGGFNGGGQGAVNGAEQGWAGGGASDVRTLPAGAGASSLESRLIVAAGGGGSAGIAAGGGDAGAPGGCCGAAGNGPEAAQPGSQTAGGVGGGCVIFLAGCGGSGSLGTGGPGGASGMGLDARAGAGGGGGLYGGGGGAGHITGSNGGAGGSSKVPAGGTIAVAPSTATPTRIDIDPFTPPPLPPRCGDGIDNDGDGLSDFPADPGCTGATDDDEAGGAPAVDRLAPTATLGGRARQKLGRIIAVTVTCGRAEDCLVSATGKLAVPGVKRPYTLRPATRRTVTRGTTLTLTLRMPKKAPAAARKSLRRHKTVRATVTITVADAAGNTATLTRTIRIVR